VIVERVIAEPVAAVLAARATVAQLHPRVRAAAEPLYRDGHRSAAVFEAYKAIEQRVRELTGRNESARALIAKAFDQDAPLQPLARALWTRPASVPRAGLDRGIGSASGSPGAPPSQNDKKVTVCHNKHTISISKNALKAHLAIGDKLGPCQQSTNTTQSPHAQNASPHAGTPGSAGAANAQGNGKGKGKS
jgi:uncharacterized protein Ymh